jgi:hypothetical protein
MSRKFTKIKLIVLEKAFRINEDILNVVLLSFYFWSLHFISFFLTVFGFWLFLSYLQTFRINAYQLRWRLWFFPIYVYIVLTQVTNPTRNHGELMWSHRVSNSCSTSDTRHEHHLTWESCWTPVCINKCKYD